MKKNSLLILIVTIISAFCLFALSFPSDKYMSTEDARKKWGDAEFKSEKFKSGDSTTRASMVASLISNKSFIGKSLAETYKELGPSTGYYFSDLIPAYAIGDLSHGRKETWQIIFIPDTDSKIIEEVKIHKKCCAQ